MHGPDSHHAGGDHTQGHVGHYGDMHVAGYADHAIGQGHDLSIAHAGDILGHSGAIAIDAVVFLAVVDFITGHHGPGFHYSLSNNTLNYHFDHHYRQDGTGQGGLGLKRKRYPFRDGSSAVPVNAVQANKDSSIFIVHAHNIGDPDLDSLFKIWPERYGFVELTDLPGFSGVSEQKKGSCFGWDWFHTDRGPLPPGALPGVKVNSTRNKRVYQLGKINPALSMFRRFQIYCGLGHPPRKGELVSDIHSNCTVESYDQGWTYDALGTAEAKIELRVKGNKRFYQGTPASSGWLFSRRSVLPHWSIVWDPYEAHRAAALALAKRLHHELSEFKRVPGKLEAYMDMLKRLPDGGGYSPPPEIADGITTGTKQDEREMDEWELERARRADRQSDSQLPTTTSPLPTTPATPSTPAPNIDSLPGVGIADDGDAIGGLHYSPNAPAAPTPAGEGPATGFASATELAPSAPGYVTADLALPSKAPMPETQYQKAIDSSPVKTVDSSGAVEVHVNYNDFDEYKGHHA